jgi:hypothetical protein
MNHGWRCLTRGWSIVDFCIIVLNSLMIITSFSGDNAFINLENIRVIEAFLMILMWLKMLYYLTLIGEISPLIDIIGTILNDIGYFMIIYIIALMGFIQAFYIIGRN